MVAVELPAPRLGRRRLAHHRDVVAPLAVAIEVVVVQLAERVVEPHDVARLLQPLRAQRRAQQPERRRRAAPASSRGSSRPAGRRSAGSSTSATPGSSSAKTVLSRCSGVSAARKPLGRLAHAGSVETPVDRIGNSPGSTWPCVGDALERLGEALRLGVARHLEEPRAPLLVGFRGLAEGDAGERGPRTRPRGQVWTCADTSKCARRNRMKLPCPLILIHSERFAEHQTPPGHPERPERAEVMDAVAGRWRARGVEIVAPRAATREQLARVHDADYLRRIAETAGRATALDPDTYTSPESYEIALLAAGAGIDAVERVMARRRTARRWRWCGRRATTPSATARWGSACSTTSPSPPRTRARSAPRKRGHRRLRRPPRQRHAAHLRGRSARALRLDAPVSVLSGHRRRR